MKLFQDDKDTKFESNSQLLTWCNIALRRCFRTTKIQNLRAIHNFANVCPTLLGVVSGRQRYKIWEQFTTGDAFSGLPSELFQDDKDTKFESNSQLLATKNIALLSCFRTTKIQNLRAIHNKWLSRFLRLFVVSGRQRYKIWEQFTTNN